MSPVPRIPRSPRGSFAMPVFAMPVFAVAAIAVAVLVSLLGGAMTVSAAEVTSPLVTIGDTLPEPNPFLPDDRNLSDCLSSLPKPGCGSEERGGPLQLATFVVLMLGMAFIGWRVFRSVKRRDDAQTPT